MYRQYLDDPDMDVRNSDFQNRRSFPYPAEQNVSRIVTYNNSSGWNKQPVTPLSRAMRDRPRKRGANSPTYVIPPKIRYDGKRGGPGSSSNPKPLIKSPVPAPVLTPEQIEQNAILRRKKALIASEKKKYLKYKKKIGLSGGKEHLTATITREDCQPITESELDLIDTQIVRLLTTKHQPEMNVFGAVTLQMGVLTIETKYERQLEWLINATPKFHGPDDAKYIASKNLPRRLRIELQIAPLSMSIKELLDALKILNTGVDTADWRLCGRSAIDNELRLLLDVDRVSLLRIEDHNDLLFAGLRNAKVFRDPKDWIVTSTLFPNCAIASAPPEANPTEKVTPVKGPGAVDDDDDEVKEIPQVKLTDVKELEIEEIVNNKSEPITENGVHDQEKSDNDLKEKEEGDKLYNPCDVEDEEEYANETLVDESGQPEPVVPVKDTEGTKEGAETEGIEKAEAEGNKEDETEGKEKAEAEAEGVDNAAT